MQKYENFPNLQIFLRPLQWWKNVTHTNYELVNFSNLAEYYEICLQCHISATICVRTLIFSPFESYEAVDFSHVHYSKMKIKEKVQFLNRQLTYVKE